MRTDQLSTTAYDALGSACDSVRDPDPGGGDDVDGIRPGLVARATDVDQVREVLRAATAHQLTVVPRGAGTKLSWGVAPRSADVLLDVSALDQVVDHAAGDLILVAQAGARLGAVQDAAATAGQRLALDETVSGTTIGGLLAAGTSGPRRVGIGTARDLLIGITVVRADGVLAKAGGRVVKNVAGYDLGKLLIGSFGTLAVIVDATFRLHPVPAVSRWVTAPAADPAQAWSLVRSVLHAQVVPAAIEVDWGERSGRVSVLLDGSEEGVAARTTAVRALLGEGTGDDIEPPAYPWDTAARGEDRAVALKVTFALSGLADVLRTTAAAGAHLRGSAGAGVAYVALPHGADPETARTTLTALRTVCTRHGGSAVVVDAPAAIKAELDGWGPVAALKLMRRVKAQFDPDGLLAPGRFVGGI